LGVIPESKAVLTASNQGIPVIHDDKSDAGQAYADAVARSLGETVEQRFIEAPKKGFPKSMFRGNTWGCGITSGTKNRIRPLWPRSGFRLSLPMSGAGVINPITCPSCNRN